MDGTMSTFVVLHTPVTSAPRALAICTAKVPTPPDAPMMSTFCSGRTFPWSRRPCRAVKPEMATTAACSKVRFADYARELFLKRASVVGEGALADAKHLIARLETGHVLPDRLNHPGHVRADDGVL